MNSRHSWLRKSAVGLALLMGLLSFAADDEQSAILTEAITKAGKGLKSKESAEVKRGMMEFGFSLHRDLSKATGKSTATSPFSVMSMLSMLRTGAVGNTGKEMQKAMGGLEKLSAAQFQSGMLELNKSLRNIGKGATLAYGNLVGVDEGIVLKSQFAKTLHQNYGAEAWTRDFLAPNLIDEINGYISGQTRKMIPKLLKEEDRPDGWFLVNAGYFQSPWQFLFQLKNTTEDYDFQLVDGSTAKKPMMFHRETKFPYYAGNGFQLVSLPYENAEFIMDLIVPTIGTGEKPGAALDRVSRLLTEANYSKWLSSLEVTELDALGLPRWEVKTELRTEIVDALRKRMPLVMSTQAELTKMFEDGNAPKLGKVVHAALVKTHELGSEGSFVTYGGGLESIAPAKPSVIADHPFLAVIRHVSTGVPIFVITELDPAKTDRPKEAGAGKN